MTDPNASRPARRRRRAVRALAAGVALAFITAACGGDSSNDSAKPSDVKQSGAAAAFPAHIDHKFGRTTIPAEPQRVLSLGFQEHDAILAMGVKPIAARYWFGDKTDVIFPWAEDEAAGHKPQILELAYDNLNFEAIAALRPDLILAIYSGIKAEDYQKLSAIAPTVAQPGDYVDYGVPWQVSTKMVGQALGKAPQAEKMVADLEARFASIKAAHPQWGDLTAALAAYGPDQTGIFASQDPRSRFLSSLGFKLPAEFDKVAGDKFYGNLSREQLHLLDEDILVWDQMAYVDGGRATIEKDRIVSQLAAAKDKRMLFLEGDVENAFAFNTVLSLPFLLDKIVPELERVTAQAAR